MLQLPFRSLCIIVSGALLQGHAEKIPSKQTSQSSGKNKPLHKRNLRADRTGLENGDFPNDSTIIIAEAYAEMMDSSARARASKSSKCEVPSGALTNDKLDPDTMMFVNDLVIPPVMHDDNGTDAAFEVAVRQVEKQIFPEPYPNTTMWAYGDPSDPSSFLSGTIEVTRNKKTTVKWINELVKDPVECRKSKSKKGSCDFLTHIIKDECNDVPDLETHFHWAAPDRKCAMGPKRTDCHGELGKDGELREYFGPVPMVTHVHGAHTEAQSDGYPEAWYLPDADDLKGFTSSGRLYRSHEGCEDTDGCAVFQYTNDQDSTALWYHDHTLGLSAHNSFAMGSGFWLIREGDDSETRLKTCDGSPPVLPGPPPVHGIDPNSPSERMKIREIPLSISIITFWDDFRLRYNRYGEFGAPGELDPNVVVVNGKVWPKLEVAAERYRFRMLAALPLSHLDLFISLSFADGTSLPFYVIGTDQGMLNNVVKVDIDSAYTINDGSCGTTTEFTYPTEGNLTYFKNPTGFGGGLPMGPSERYDIIVDFGGLPNGTEVIMKNNHMGSGTGTLDPDNFLFGLTPNTRFGMPLWNNIMKFVVNTDYNKAGGDPSTDPEDLIMDESTVQGEPTAERNWTLQVLDNQTVPNTGFPEYAVYENGDLGGLIQLVFFMGIDGHLGAPGWDNIDRFDQLESWNDPISVNPMLDSTEIWNFWGWSIAGHPMHVHQVYFLLEGRYASDGVTKYANSVMPWERGPKDTIIARSGSLEGNPVCNPSNPDWAGCVFRGEGQVTKIKMHFDIEGLFVAHCHILQHEDNEMMRPFCVGPEGSDECPAWLFEDN